jgi:hypothetical protein
MPDFACHYDIIASIWLWTTTNAEAWGYLIFRKKVSVDRVEREKHPMLAIHQLQFIMNLDTLSSIILLACTELCLRFFATKIIFVVVSIAYTFQYRYMLMLGHFSF